MTATMSWSNLERSLLRSSMALRSAAPWETSSPSWDLSVFRTWEGRERVVQSVGVGVVLLNHLALSSALRHQLTQLGLE